jgi:hypothetical protein
MMRWCLFVCWVWALSGCGQSTIDGVNGLVEPEQVRLSSPEELWSDGEYTITAVEEFAMEGLVLSSRRYRWDSESRLSPIDYLMAWGPVAEGDNPNAIRWSQSWRWARYRFEYGETNLRESIIDRNSANIHIIPDPEDPYLRDALLDVRRGDIIRLRGYLVNVSGPNGWRWNSSRSRTDTGGGACEILFVTALE